MMQRILPLVLILVLLGASGCLKNLSDLTLPDAGDSSSDAALDVGPSDSGSDADLADSSNVASDLADTDDAADATDAADVDACIPMSDDDFCTFHRAYCGEFEGLDNCGTTRSVTCGACDAPDACGVEIPFVCDCLSPDDDEFCMRYGAECGVFSQVDVCGVSRSEFCGDCAGDNDECIANVCVCQPIEEDAICANEGATCGEIEADDGCGNTVTVDCGGCTTPETCGGDPAMPNQCACPSQTDAEFCASHRRNCGMYTNVDNCGVTRTADCGTCAGSSTCDDASNVCDCAVQSDTEFCAANSAECGDVSGVDACGNQRHVDCGSCPGTDVCSANNVCETCVAESEADFCARTSAECGMLTGTNNCGDEVTHDCGTCDGLGEECGVSSPPNTCACLAETTEDFCARVNAKCGPAMGVDNCGDMRTANCGTCGVGETCSANACVCQPESNASFCDRLNACGPTDAEDNCGDPRSVDCGGCDEGECGDNGQCVVCTPDPDETFCIRMRVQCGPAQGVDNCGMQRSVDECGPCDSSNGSVCVEGACCTPESDAEFCADRSIECGAFAGTDNCGQQRVVGECGPCVAPEQCNNAKQCVCIGESDAELCAQQGFNCGSATIVDQCGEQRDVTCGSCAAFVPCIGNRCLL